MKKWFEEFLENEPPYKTITIDVQQLEEICKASHFSIEQYCTRCGKLRTFKSDENELCKILREYDDRRECMPFYELEDMFYEYECGVILDFQCQHDCCEHHYIPIRIGHLSIEKIGQYPTFSKEEVNKKLYRYKSLIPQFYPELTKAVSAYSQNMGVPAFLYLRRILEHLVDVKYKRYGGKDNIKFVDKLHEVEKHEKIIPDEFDEIKNQLYSVLSKGVHEYEEEECIEMFPLVKFVIENILDMELMKKEHKKKAQEAKSMISKKVKKD